MNHFVIVGDAGFLGRHVVDAFASDGWRVTILSRRTAPYRAATVVGSDGKTIGEWASAPDGATALLNLAGRSVNCRYDARHRAGIFDSRVDSTRALASAIATSATPPRACGA